MNDQRGKIRVKPQGHRHSSVLDASPRAPRAAGAVLSENYVN
ncbi:hypothetical protein [Streptomyces sp. NPDC056660]